SELEKLEKMLFGKEESGSLVPSRRVAGPLIASDENRFLEQHELFSKFTSEIESGETSLVSVEATHVGPLGSVIHTGHQIFEEYLSSTPRRIFFMVLLLSVFWGIY